MPRAMVIKELRETVWIAAAALAGYLYCTTIVGLGPGLYAGYNRAIPFVRDGFVGAFAMVSACLAIALGLRQTVGEILTYPFLLHRPAGRGWLIGAKLVVGLGLYLICSAVPILVYACWAATPGTHASPFSWSMTMPAWNAWIAMTVLYLAAFLSGIRPARWYGSRLLPVAAFAGLVALLAVPPWWSLRLPGLPWWSPGVGGLGLVVLLDVLLVRSILFVARSRDF